MNSVHVTNHNKHKTRGVRNRFTSSDPHFETEKYRLYDKDSGIIREYTLGQLINTSFRRGKFEYRGKSTGHKDSEGTLIYEGDVVERLNEVNPEYLQIAEKRLRQEVLPLGRVQEQP